MSGFLLDTHVWLWAASDTRKLSPEVAKVLGDESEELWLSPLSVFEVHVLAERRRISLPRPPGEWIRSVRSAVPMNEAALTCEIVLHSRALGAVPSDLVDRMLIATAAALDLTLITADRQIARTSHCNVLHNRRRRA